ncbi:MAG: hypothetical protein HKN94_03575 [Acidimicrobiales bacterium]|nr:hypothetical protein [Acidimicrobiales bacterium]
MTVSAPTLQQAARTEQPAAAPAHRAVVLACLLIVTVTAFRFWIPMLTGGFRFDENSTAWIVSDTIGDAIERSWNHQGQSPLYFALLWFWQFLAGSSELALRVPSIVALFVGAWHVFRLGERFNGHLAGVLAATFFLGIPNGATEARPYIFLVVAMILGARAGLAWLDSGRLRYGLTWAAACAFAFAMHPFAVYAILGQFVFPWVSWQRRRSMSELATVGFFGMAMMAPVVPQVLMLLARQPTLVLVDAPSMLDLLKALAPLALVPVLVLGAIGVPLGRWSGLKSVDAPTWLLLLGWTTFPVLGLFAQSHLTGSSVFVERYWFAAAPAVALLSATFVMRIGMSRLALGIALGFFALISASELKPFGTHEWRAAVALIEAAPADAAIWTYAGYVESTDPSSFAEDAATDYLSAPYLAHGVERPVRAIPVADDQSGRDILDGAVRDAAATQRTIVLAEPHDGSERRPGLHYVEDELLAAGYIVSESVTVPGVRLTTFTVS